MIFAKIAVFAFAVFLWLGPEGSRWRAAALRGFRSVCRPWVVGLAVVGYFALVLAGNLLQYEAFDATLWDLTTYIQPIYTAAVSGSPVTSFMDQLSVRRTSFTTR